MTMTEPSGALWAIIDIIGVVILAGALIYGTIVWRRRRRDRTMRAAQDEVVRDNYRHGG
jgi:hypothetical protein